MKKETELKEVKEITKEEEQAKAQAFADEYKALCNKHGYTIQVTPAWRVSQDTGDWRLVLQNSIAKLPSD